MPTVKQRTVALNLLENPGKPIGTAMKEAGYAHGMVVNPKDLTESRGWKELMNEYLPDKTLLQVHKEGLAAMRTITSPTEPDHEVEDHPTRHKFLETAYKLKKYVGPEGGLTQFNVGGDMSLEFSK